MIYTEQLATFYSKNLISEKLFCNNSFGFVPKKRRTQKAESTKKWNWYWHFSTFKNLILPPQLLSKVVCMILGLLLAVEIWLCEAVKFAIGSFFFQNRVPGRVEGAFVIHDWLISDQSLMRHVNGKKFQFLLSLFLYITSIYTVANLQLPNDSEFNWYSNYYDQHSFLNFQLLNPNFKHRQRNPFWYGEPVMHYLKKLHLHPILCLTSD